MRNAPPIDTKIIWHFGCKDLKAIRESAKFNLGMLPTKVRHELLARWCGFKAFSGMQEALSAAKKSDLVLTLSSENAQNFAAEEGIRFDSAVLYLTLATAASMKVARSTPELYPAGYGRMNFWARGEYRAKLLSENPNENRLDLINNDCDARLADARFGLLKAHSGGDFLRALALASLIDSIKTKNDKHTSYGLKHVAERLSYRLEDGTVFPEEYVCNGAMIAAAIYAGFTLFSDGSCPNAQFNMSEKSIKPLWNLSNTF